METIVKTYFARGEIK